MHKAILHTLYTYFDVIKYTLGVSFNEV